MLRDGDLRPKHLGYSAVAGGSWKSGGDGDGDEIVCRIRQKYAFTGLKSTHFMQMSIRYKLFTELQVKLNQQHS